MRTGLSRIQDPKSTDTMSPLGDDNAAERTPPRRQAPEISLFFFSADADDRPEEKYALVLECAELAEQSGLHAVWVPERHFDAFGAPYSAPEVLLAAIAARTRRLLLRAGSVVLPLHDPLTVAERWSVLQTLSGGRAGISLASGWHADDFVLAPDAYDTRKTLVAEGYRELQRLWNGEPTKRKAPHGRTVETRTYPLPRDLPPMWLTSAKASDTWRTAGELGANVLTALLQQTVDEIAERVDLYRQALTAAGHDQRTEVTVMLHTHLGPAESTVRERVREPLVQYLSSHLDLLAKQATAGQLSVNPDDIPEEDRRFLLEHSFQRYLTSAGLFGTVESCRPMVERLHRAGATELGCLVDFGLPREQVLECVRELGRLREALTAESAAGDPVTEGATP